MALSSGTSCRWVDVPWSASSNGKTNIRIPKKNFRRPAGRYRAAAPANSSFRFTDSGLAAHMAGITKLEPGRDDLLRGALFETYVAQNLAGLLEAHLPDAWMGYWHEQGRHEVDFVIETGRKVFAIEVKASARWSERDLP
jgi:predicted AAA+ superfamily ATPase